ncbi:ribbon-helix-helix domain-containing protein [Burkholderia ambifaria]|uniref:Ribbon-helix-helix domain-containing protein n=1 Tax=Burkholderia ambifaria MEX-5 TaxID=396597 RepID=B1SXR3_9BURK|nr:ribbon-helix-helix domain-containing protein [Burkholderia ambifaria]EDT43930.1 conserved hypothetical protein [Burkholderia ambifaria MEX-5]
MCSIYSQADPILYECRTRSVRIEGVTTTIRLENLFWHTLSDLAADTEITTNQLIARLHREVTEYAGQTVNFASFLRVTCLRYESLRSRKLASLKLSPALHAQLPGTQAVIRA